MSEQSNQVMATQADKTPKHIGLFESVNGAGKTYNEAIADIESFAQNEADSMTVQALLNQHLMTLLSAYVQEKVKKQNEIMSKINNLRGSVKNKAEIKALRKKIKTLKRVAKREGESKPDGLIALQIQDAQSTIDKDLGIDKKSTNELNADQTEYNQVSAQFDSPTQTLQATSQGFTTNTQTLSGDMKNQIQVIGTLVQLASYVASKL